MQKAETDGIQNDVFVGVVVVVVVVVVLVVVVVAAAAAVVTAVIAPHEKRKVDRFQDSLLLRVSW